MGGDGDGDGDGDGVAGYDEAEDCRIYVCVLLRKNCGNFRVFKLGDGVCIAVRNTRSGTKRWGWGWGW